MENRVFAVTTYRESGEKAVKAAEEWKKLGICAIGWKGVTDLKNCKNEDEVAEQLRKNGSKILFKSCLSMPQIPNCLDLSHLANYCS